MSHPGTVGRPPESEPPAGEPPPLLGSAGIANATSSTRTRPASTKNGTFATENHSEQRSHASDRRDVADRAPEPHVDVARRPLPEPGEGQRLELGERPLPEEAEDRRESGEEGPEPGSGGDGRERDDRPRRSGAHHPLPGPGPVRRPAPEPRGDELGHREGGEERADGPRVEPPIEQIRREVRQEDPGRDEVREVPGAEARKAGPRTALPARRGHRHLPAPLSLPRRAAERTPSRRIVSRASFLPRSASVRPVVPGPRKRGQSGFSGVAARTG